MPTTLAPPPSSTRSASFPEHELEDWPIEAVSALRHEVERQEPDRQRQPDATYIEPRRRFWLPDQARRDAVLGSDAAFLVSVAISWMLSGVMAYFAALWMNGPIY